MLFGNLGEHFNQSMTKGEDGPDVQIVAAAFIKKNGGLRIRHSLTFCGLLSGPRQMPGRKAADT